jgi:hypothetical protein
MNTTTLVVVTYVIATLFVVSDAITVPSQNVVAQGAQQTPSHYAANLTGESALPPVVTNATGSANFTLPGDGNTRSYNIPRASSSAGNHKKSAEVNT